MKALSFVYALHACLTSYPQQTVVVDLFDCKNTKGRICYFSTQYEDWRPDAKDFPKETLGNKIGDWKGERWVNTNDARVRAILSRRMDLAKARGCLGIDEDNVDGYSSNTGFKITSNDAKAFVKWLSSEAHKRGLLTGLKNASEIARELSPFVDFHVAEECSKYKECDKYPKDKTFFIEYQKVDDKICKQRPYTLFSDLALKKFEFCK